MAEQITEENKVIEQTENQKAGAAEEETSAVALAETEETQAGQPKAEERPEPETVQAEEMEEIAGNKGAAAEESVTESIAESVTEESKSEQARKFEPYVRKRPIKEYYSFGDSDYEFSREDYIITRLRDEDLMEYLRMQEKKEEKQRAAKEARNAKIYSLIIFAIAAVSVVLIVWFLRDNPAVLVNILYIAGILLVMWFWKHPKEDGGKK